MQEPKTPPRKLKLKSPLREKTQMVDIEKLLRKNVDNLAQKLDRYEDSGKLRGPNSPSAPIQNQDGKISHRELSPSVAFNIDDAKELADDLRQKEDPNKITIDYEIEDKLEEAEDVKKKFNST